MKSFEQQQRSTNSVRGLNARQSLAPHKNHMRDYEPRQFFVGWPRKSSAAHSISVCIMDWIVMPRHMHIFRTIFGDRRTICKYNRQLIGGSSSGKDSRCTFSRVGGPAAATANNEETVLFGWRNVLILGIYYNGPPGSKSTWSSTPGDDRVTLGMRTEKKVNSIHKSREKVAKWAADARECLFVIVQLIKGVSTTTTSSSS